VCCVLYDSAFCMSQVAWIKQMNEKNNELMIKKFCARKKQTK